CPPLCEPLLPKKPLPPNWLHRFRIDYPRCSLRYNAQAAGMESLSQGAARSAQTSAHLDFSEQRRLCQYGGERSQTAIIFGLTVHPALAFLWNLTMRHNLKSLALVLLVTVVVLNLFMFGLLSYTLNASYQRTIDQVRTNVTNLALMMDHSITGAAREIVLVVEELQYYLDRELAAGRQLPPEELRQLVRDREGWIGHIARLHISNADGLVMSAPPEYRERLGFAQL